MPTLVFDDGRFTYFRFPGNREVPAVFHVLGDGSETLVNARMEDDLLVVDRVSRRLMLRAGSAVVGVWNEAFDLDGKPPSDGTTVPGVQRLLKADATAATPTRHAKGERHDERPATIRSRPRGAEAWRADADGNTLAPLPGEPGIPNVAQRQRIRCRKGLLARRPAGAVAGRGVGVLDPALRGQRQEGRRR